MLECAGTLSTGMFYGNRDCVFAYGNRVRMVSLLGEEGGRRWEYVHWMECMCVGDANGSCIDVLV